MKIRGTFASTYDRFVKRQSLLPAGLLELLKSTGTKNVLDFGCGTGTISVGLSMAGFDVTGVDYSPGMLKAARKKAQEHKANVEFVLADIARIRLRKEFDIIICLGNTIPHFTNYFQLNKFLQNCRRHLKPGGRIIFQELNYDRILKERPSTFAIDIDHEIVRFKQYRYRKNLIDFVVTIIDGNKTPPRQSVSIVKIKPWTKNELKNTLNQSGFKTISFYGDYSKTKFSLKAKDLIITAGT
jgi:glycine/sarcosine N-methyltransferase